MSISINSSLDTYLKDINYILIPYESLSCESLNNLSAGEGFRLTDKSFQEYYVRKKAVGIGKKRDIKLHDNVFEVENGFGHIVSTGSDKVVYKALYRLTDSDIPF